MYQVNGFLRSATVHHCKTLYSDPFVVHSHKVGGHCLVNPQGTEFPAPSQSFPGLDDSTELSRSFAMQGLKMRIKGGLA